MTPKERAVMQQALEDLIESARLLGSTQAIKGYGYYTEKDAVFERAMYESVAKHKAALREALAEQAEQEPVCCVADLDSLQRGFVLDRGYSLHDALYAAPVEPVKQEPVSYVYVFDGGHTEFEELSVALPKGKHKLYTHPVRTKDLTDAEIWEIVDNTKPLALDFARAVIAADREKNK